MPGPKDCPCYSGLRYAVCCEPLHVGRLRAETPEKLMRSRYAAFALGRGEYLVDTLSSDHDDRAVPRMELARQLSQIHERQRFLGLTVLHAKGDEVLFYAKIFEDGAEYSFAELSVFVREQGNWRYARGMSLPGENLPRDPKALTLEMFLNLMSVMMGS